MGRLDKDRQARIEPERVQYAKQKIKDLGIDITFESSTRIEFQFNGSLVKFFPYSGWHTGKTIKDGRGLSALIRQIAPVKPVPYAIKIQTKRDIFIIEKISEDGRTILKGSRILCGCCGHPVGSIAYDLKSPFLSNDFFAALIDGTLQRAPLGVKHTICNHYLFTLQNSYDFVSLHNYLKAYPDEQGESQKA